jgi:hypothetical protein
MITTNNTKLSSFIIDQYLDPLISIVYGCGFPDPSTQGADQISHQNLTEQDSFIPGTNPY